MASMFDWHWLPVGAMATPTLRKKLQPLLFAGSARRGGLQASGITLERRNIERECQEELDWESEGGSEEDASDVDGPIITYEETE